jgi:hypothetical protein
VALAQIHLSMQGPQAAIHTLLSVYPRLLEHGEKNTVVDAQVMTHPSHHTRHTSSSRLARRVRCYWPSLWCAWPRMRRVLSRWKVHSRPPAPTDHPPTTPHPITPSPITHHPACFAKALAYLLEAEQGCVEMRSGVGGGVKELEEIYYLLARVYHQQVRLLRFPLAVVACISLVPVFTGQDRGEKHGCAQHALV